MFKGLQEVQNGRIIFLDMNSFFASVEQQYNPEFRDVPLAVVSHITNNGTVLAASYTAKAFGITTGTKVREAQELCPNIKFTTTTPHLYRKAHEQFMAILRDLCGPEVQAFSIDEASIFLSPNWYGSHSAHDLALAIKKRFREELGDYIRCSIGIAPNTLLGKVASNLQKPNGLTEITLENLESTLGKLELTDLPGIAQKSALRLNNYSIYTPLDLYSTPIHLLQKWFGIWGCYWWYRLHGYEIEGPKAPIKSFSHQHVLTHWIYTFSEAEPIITKMTDRLIHRLHRNSLQCRTMWINISLNLTPSLFVKVQFDSPTDSYLELLTTAKGLYHGLHPLPRAPIRKISLGFEQLNQKDNSLQLDLFNTKPRQEDVSQALEDIRTKYGFESIQLGNVMSVKSDVARDQIGFGRIKDVSG